MMKKFHMVDTGEVVPAAQTALLYGRITACVLENGKVVCDNHLFCLDTECPPEPGERLLVWCDHEYYCCSLEEYENSHCN